MSAKYAIDPVSGKTKLAAQRLTPGGKAIVTVSNEPSAATPLAGTASTTGVLGPFTPAELQRPLTLRLTGTWAGTVAVKRSIDGGTTKDALTVGGAAWAVFTGNCCEPVWEPSEAGETYYLDITLTSGSVTYRLSQ